MIDTIAARLASPSDVRTLVLGQGWWPQSLAHGAAGVALLHIERARAGLASWQCAHEWLACAAAGEVASGAGSHLHYGAPAIAFALHAASDHSSRYSGALATLDEHIAMTTRSRIAAAHTRIDRGDLPALAEFDAIRGLAGVGALLLRRDPHGDLIREVLSYLVRLTEPVHDIDLLPGWWTRQDPSGQLSSDTPGGHANNGMAHGIAGPLALLSLAARADVTVDGQTDAIRRICTWLDQWRQDSGAGSWWPYVVSREELHGRSLGVSKPGRPSWCYGTAGLARAQQLAAIVLGETARQQIAEQAVVSALADPAQLAATTDLSLCHGFAGLAHIAARAARDGITPGLDACVLRLLNSLVPDSPFDIDRLVASLLTPPAGDLGLLEGATGVALALLASQTGQPILSAWDACLLIN